MIFHKALKLGMEQLEPDGRCCAICGDNDHQAFECAFNPLVKMRKYDLIQESLSVSLAHAQRYMQSVMHRVCVSIELGTSDAVIKAKCK